MFINVEWMSLMDKCFVDKRCHSLDYVFYHRGTTSQLLFQRHDINRYSLETNYNYYEIFSSKAKELDDYGFKDEHTNLWHYAIPAKVYD